MIRNLLNKWEMPTSTRISANDYLIVVASGKNRTRKKSLFQTDFLLHTNFRLNDREDQILLVKPDGQTIVSSFKWSDEVTGDDILPSQEQGISYGLLEENGAFLRLPTPGEANNPELFLLEEVIFSKPSQAFSEAMQVELTSPTEGLEIRYTLDGERPEDGKGTLYTEPISISSTTMVRARLEDPNSNALGELSARHYIQLSGDAIPAKFETGAQSLAEFKSTLPIVVLENFGGEKFNTSDLRTTTFSIFEPVEGFATFQSIPRVSTRAGIKKRGKSSLNFPKVQWRIELRNQEDHDKADRLLDMPADADWILNAPWVDKAMIRNSACLRTGTRNRYSCSPHSAR